MQERSSILHITIGNATSSQQVSLRSGRGLNKFSLTRRGTVCPWRHGDRGEKKDGMLPARALALPLVLRNMRDGVAGVPMKESMRLGEIESIDPMLRLTTRKPLHPWSDQLVSAKVRFWKTRCRQDSLDLYK